MKKLFVPCLVLLSAPSSLAKLLRHVRLAHDVEEALPRELLAGDEFASRNAFFSEMKAPFTEQMVALGRLLTSKQDEMTRGDGSVSNLPWVNLLLHSHGGNGKTHTFSDNSEELFKKFDFDNDGQLSVAEVGRMAPNDPDRFCNAAVAVMCVDTDASNSVSSAEFSASVADSDDDFQACYVQFEPNCHGHGGRPDKDVRFSSASTKVIAQFRKADTDSDGQLSAKEFRSVAAVMDPNVTKVDCLASISVRCADEDGSNTVNLGEFLDVFGSNDLMNDFKHCMSLNAPACRNEPTEEKNATADSLHGVPYSPSLCKELFAYQHSRDACMSLQRQICGKKCSTLTPDSVKQCGEMQETICQVDKPGPVPLPLKSGSVPDNTLNTTVTVCVAFRTVGVPRIWVAREGGIPKPLATKLSYTDCTQFHAHRGMQIGIYKGARRIARHQCQERDEIVLVGKSQFDSEKAVTSFSFPDDGMQRPIICHAASGAPALTVSVAGRSWYPFDNTKNLKGLIAYLHCEVLALDHRDLLREKETLLLREAGKSNMLGRVSVSAETSLYLIKEVGPNATLGYKSLNLGHMKYK